MKNSFLILGFVFIIGGYLGDIYLGGNTGEIKSDFISIMGYNPVIVAGLFLLACAFLLHKERLKLGISDIKKRVTKGKK